MKLNDYLLTSKKSLFNIELYINSVSDASYGTVHPDELPELWKNYKKLAPCERLYFSLISQNENTKGDFSVQIDINKQPRIGKHIISQLLYKHFRQKQIATFDNIGNVEVWIKNKQQTINNVTQYERYSLIPRYSDAWHLNVSYNGISNVYNISIEKLDIQTECYDIVVRGEVVYNKRITPQQKQHLGEAYPKINRKLSKELNVKIPYSRNTDRYTTTYNHITTFVKEHLSDPELQNIFSISTEMMVPSACSIMHVRDDAKLLQFANGSTGTDPYYGIFGAQAPGIFQPSIYPKVKFFFIYHKPDINVCHKLYDVLRNGILTSDRTRTISPSLSACIKQPFATDKNGSICFENINTALEEIKKQLEGKLFEKDTQYFAIYISPISKDDTDNSNHDLYNQLKELLLVNNILSQVIYRERPHSNNFRYHLPNIAIAILGKLGGIPWQIYNESPKKELVVGVGAYKFNNIKERYVGCAVSFDSNGITKRLDGHKSKDIYGIMASIRRALMQFVKEEGDIDRLVIHYYKDISKKEAKPITEMLHHLNLKIPVIIVTINKTESDDILMFDETQDGLMPLSGTILKIHDNNYLLYNNSCYVRGDKSDKLFPIRLRLRKMEYGRNSDLSNEEASEIITQVYQFSRINWQTVKLQNLPVTLKYSEMIAKSLPYFEQNALPEFGKKTLWIL